MIQLYFLSIVFNGLTGFLFFFGDFGDAIVTESEKKFSVAGDGFRLILGILAVVTGILKLLSPMSGLPILGDLLPALAGIAGGFLLIYGFYRDRSSGNIDTEGLINHFGEILLHYRKTAGIILLAAAALHFIFPNALFL